MIFASILLIALFCLYISKAIEIQRPLNTLLINFLLVCANIIASFEILSLAGILNQPWALISVQFIFTAAAGIFYYFSKKVTPAKSNHFGEKIKDFFAFCKEHKFFTALLVVILLVYLFMLVLSIVFPQNTSDSLYNHLARIAHWLQQSSLKPYDSFSNFGITYPYNNSLLMMWSVLFLHADRLVGFVQWFAAFFLALSIYGLATLLKFTKIQAGYSALIFLTFPIVLLQSVTAQNDILVSSFFIIGLYFLIEAFQSSNRLQIVFSALSFGLAAGTKQYLAFAIPGVVIIFLYLFFSNKSPLRLILGRDFVVLTLGFTLLIGSYTYIQNSIYFGSPTGPAESGFGGFSQTDGHFGERLAMNSLRLSSQFISCEGMPIPLQNSCLAVKGTLFRHIFSNPNFNLESDKFMLEPNCDSTCFSFSTRYPFNEESSWFGLLSWILLIPGCIIAIITAIRKREFLQILLILTSIIYFLITSVFKNGWDAYQGRYLILSVALVTPFVGFILGDRTILQKYLSVLIGCVAIFILIFTAIDNDSKPLISSMNMENLQHWGIKNDVPVVTKIAFKLTPWFENPHSYFDYSFNELRTFFANDMSAPYSLINSEVPEHENIGLIANNGIFMDYLFYGNFLTRKVYDLPNYSNTNDLWSKIQEEEIHFLLISPNIKVKLPNNFFYTSKSGEWLLYKIK